MPIADPNSRVPDSDGSRHGGGSTAAAISNAVVSVYAEYLGRGPTRARTTFGRDLVTVVLEETLTKAEQRLVREGESETVISARRTYQRTMRSALVTAVEHHTGRSVAAFLSDQSAEPDVAIEAFVLAPQPEPTG
jgi:uncharacterized protein YbcI